MSMVELEIHASGFAYIFDNSSFILSTWDVDAYPWFSLLL